MLEKTTKVLLVVKNYSLFYQIVLEISIKFLKSFNTRHCLVLIFEKWGKTLDKGIQEQC